VLRHQIFERQAASWCKEFDCKQYCRDSLQLGDHWGLYGTLRN